MTTTIHESGTARRRRKAIERRARVHALESNLDIAAGRMPRHVVAASYCGCGYRAWLLPGASDEDREGFDRDVANHADYCGGGEF